MTPGQAARHAFWLRYTGRGPIPEGVWDDVAQAAIDAHAEASGAPPLTMPDDELELVRAVAADMLSRFGPSGSGHTARVGQVQIARWRKAAGLEG